MIMLSLTAAFLVSFGLSWLAQRPGSIFSHTDIPNHRSLHTERTPTSGGIAIIIGSLLGWGLVFPSAIDNVEIIVLLGAGLLLALVAAWDDRQPVTPVIRLMSQLVAASSVIFAGLQLNSLDLPLYTMLWSEWVAMGFTLIFMLWMINLYNFMDGMDGFATGMGAIGFASIAILAGFAGATDLFWVCLILVVSCVGFLAFNFPPARIFMGDIGSTFLGFMAAIAILWADLLGVLHFWQGVLIFSPFIADATFTLIRRAANRERVWEAHRTHTYQRCVAAGWSHRRTVIWAYILMVACALSAWASGQVSAAVQAGILAFWVVFYAGLMYAVSRMEPRKTNQK